MKIGLVCPYNISKGGGVQEIVLATKAELIKRGHDVKIITPLHREMGAIELPDVIFVGSSTDFRSPTHTSVQVAATNDSDKIESMLDAEQFDILHFHEPWVPMISRQILMKSKSVNIATFHAKVPETIMSRTLARVVTPYLKSVLKYLDELTAVSESGAEYVNSLTDEPVTIIPNGIDLDKYKFKSHHQVGGKTIFYIGRLEKRKGVKYLLQAFQILLQDEPNAKLIIAGDGPDREKLELLAEELKLTNVSFLGYISEELKLDLLAEADLFCSPALYGESFGIVLLEAMATGTVIVAGNNSGYSGVMQDVGAISLINPQDSLEFARRLRVLLNEEPLRALWRTWAKDYVQQFNYTQIVDQYEELYRESLKNGR
jgi:phosphatidylinositol alpha-mannosyltransferase